MSVPTSCNASVLDREQVIRSVAYEASRESACLFVRLLWELELHFVDIRNSVSRQYRIDPRGGNIDNDLAEKAGMLSDRIVKDAFCMDALRSMELVSSQIVEQVDVNAELLSSECEVVRDKAIDDLLNSLAVHCGTNEE